MKRLAMVGTLVVPLLASYGCATQNWVVDTVREMDKDLVARVARIETAAAAEKVRVDGQLAEIRGIATDARNRADAAQRAADAAQRAADIADQKAVAVDGRLTRVLANRLKRADVQQVEVSFDTGKSDLSPAARGALEGILKVLADNPTYTADVVGYTDTVGTADSNVNLSWHREEAVRRFLMERGAALNRLYFIGVGEELAGDDVKDAAKRAKNRKVTINVFKPAD